jgi:hypothetical protein
VNWWITEYVWACANCVDPNVSARTIKIEITVLVTKVRMWRSSLRKEFDGSILRHKVKKFNPESGLGSHRKINIALATSRILGGGDSHWLKCR